MSEVDENEQLEAQLSTLKGQRRSIKASITRIQTFVNNFNIQSGNLHDLVVREEILRKNFDKYIECQCELENLDYDAYYLDREEVEDKFFSISSKIKSLLNNVASATSNSSNTTSAGPIQVKLPHIQITPFSGKTDQWKTFYSLFNATINNNNQLDNVQRFYYLKSFLRDEPLNLINELELTDGNYIKAVDILKKRYDNKLVNVNHHIKMLLDIPSVIKGNAVNLREFVTNVKQHINALESLSLPVDSWDVLLVHLLSKKVDFNTHKAFELERNADTLPTFKEFIEFVSKRALAFENVDSNVGSSFLNKNSKFSNNKVSQLNVNNSQNSTEFIKSKKTTPFVKKCLHCCSTQHTLFSCQKFIQLPNHDKISFVRNNNLCQNCLSKSHSLSHCTSRLCWTCGLKHHTMLHSCFDNKDDTVASVASSSKSNENSVASSGVTLSNVMSNQVLLATALVNVKCSSNKLLTARCLLDSASQTSFVTEEFFHKTGLRPYKQSVNVFGLSGNKTLVKNYVELPIGSRYDKYYHVKEQCAIVDTITVPLPQQALNITSLNIPANAILADESFNTPNKIDVLLGASVFYSCLQPQVLHLGLNLPVLQLTRFGYIVAGNILQPNANNVSMHNLVNYLNTQHEPSNDNLCDILLKFWNVEEIQSKTLTFGESKQIENHFLSTIEHVGNRFFLQLPFKSDVEFLLLNGSYNVALRRFKLLEKQFQKNSNLFIQYKQFIDEYLKLGHAAYVNIDFNNPKEISDGYFLPHHAVFKNSSTTSIRVVFDASAKTPSGKSLNDCFITVSPPQRDLYDLLINFRSYKYALTTDIQKMYRQIYIKSEHTKFQRILWREDSTQTLQCIELKTVTYGTSCAPFLAVRTIRHLANLFLEKHPLASSILLNNCYIDDIITGCNNIEQLFSIKNDLTNLLDLGSFKLHKWCSNSELLLNAIPKEERESFEVHFSEGNNVIKTLGLFWDPTEDVLKVAFNNNIPTNISKRSALSFIAKIYDPLGLIGPVITPFKLFIQKLWCSKLDWDVDLPKDMQNTWQQLVSKISHIVKIRIPRWIQTHLNYKIMQLHGFADASNICYGAVLYMRTVYEDNSVSTKLLTSKSRIAPLKRVTIPRLELLSILLLSRLMKKFLSIYPQRLGELYIWSDSTIALCWVNSDPSKWNSFVSNRVLEIRENVPQVQWCHINSKENPADCLSRGLDAEKLSTFSLWFDGPSILSNHNFIPPIFNSSKQVNCQQEIKSVALINVNQPLLDDKMLERFSSFTRMIRTLAYCIRFAIITRKLNNNLRGKILSVSELETTTNKIISLIQYLNFHNEIILLQNKEPILTGKLKSLNPFLDENQLLRVGGRLKFANIHLNQKYPIILPNHHVTELIVRYEHTRLGHASAQLLLSNLRLKYWPLGGRRYVKKIIFQCLTCFRFRSVRAQQIMAQLPPNRIVQSRPFQNVGVDLAGPILIRQSRIRKAIQTKAYVTLFICMAVKAVHLELVSDLTSDNFLLALKRFVARRGLPVNIYSDNATNFHGTHNYLNSVYSFFDKNKEQINDFCVINKINWNFITPNAPHHGGLWEANIKCMKNHFKRVMGTTILSFEETASVLCQIEAILNSRPLLPLTDDPNDLNILTPGHFLVQTSLLDIPEKNYADTPNNRLQFWQQCCKIQQSFWKRWHVEYLHNLQSRTKWCSTRNDIKLNTMVLLIENNIPPMQWLVGRVIELIRSPSDNHIRTVVVKTTKGVYKRPITKLAPLPFENFDN